MGDLVHVFFFEIVTLRAETLSSFPCRMRSAFPMLWSSLSSQNNWAEKMHTSATSKQTHLAKIRRKNLLDYTCRLQPLVSFRCSQMVTAMKGFSIHRSCNVLTLSLKRFSVFSGEKILKVPEKY